MERHQFFSIQKCILYISFFYSPRTEHHRVCRFLLDFYCLSSCYETTDDKNGLSSSWAFSSHEGDTKSAIISALPFEEKPTGLFT